MSDLFSPCECGGRYEFDHTDYYDFDIYKCNQCGKEFSMFADSYGIDPDDDVYDDEYEEQED